MSEEKTEAKEEAGKKPEITEIRLPIHKIGDTDAAPLDVMMIPFAIWTAVRYWKGGFPLAQMGLYILFVLAFVIGQKYLFSFYAFYDNSRKTIGCAQYLLRGLSEEIPVADIRKIKVNTVLMTEKKISCGLLPRFPKGSYTVYRIDGESEPDSEGKTEHEGIDLWLFMPEHVEKFEEILQEALSDSGNAVAVERDETVFSWTDYRKVYPNRVDEAVLEAAAAD